MAVITSGKTFANGEQLSASKLNQVITAATFNASDAVDGSTMTLIGGAMAVADEGIATGKIAPVHGIAALLQHRAFHVKVIVLIYPGPPKCITDRVRCICTVCAY